jgi:hypothetical protein
LDSSFAAIFATKLLSFSWTSGVEGSVHPIVAATMPSPMMETSVNKSNKKQIQKVIGANSPRKGRRRSDEKIERKVASARATSERDKAAAGTGGGKIGAMVTMLRRPKEATIEDMCKATGWQAHSVRGAISGAIKKRLSLAVTSEKTNGVRVYRIAN